MASGLKLLFQFRTSKGFLGAVIQTLSTNILIQIINVATGVITARALAPHGRGELAAMIMWPGFLAALLTFGMQTSLVYQCRNGAERIGELVATALVLAAIGGTMATIIGVIGIPFWLHDYSSQTIRFARWAMLAAPLSLVGGILYTAAQAVQEFGQFNKYRALPNVLVLCTLSALSLMHLLSPRAGALAYLLSNVPIVILNGLWVWRKFDLKFDKIREYAGTLLNYGIRAWGMDCIGAISDQVDRVLVIGFLTPRDMGLYVVALSSARLFSIFPSALCAVMTPKIVMLGPKKGAPLVVRMGRITFVLMCAGAVPLGLVAPYAIRVVYGHAFLPATPVFRILLAEAVFSGFTWLLAQGFSWLGKPGRSTLQQMLGLSASVPLLLILVPRFGIEGACLAILASTLIRMSFAALSYRFLFGESLMHFIPRFSDLHWLLDQVRPPQPGSDMPDLEEKNAEKT